MISTTLRRPPTPEPLPTDFFVHQFSVDDYHRMIDAGILTGEHKVELLKGWIVDKMPQKPRHSSCITRTARILNKVLTEDWVVRVQMPITLLDSEPEPDIAVAAGQEELYDTRHPGPEEIALVIEAAEVSLNKDRLEKGHIYAEARIAHYWLLNLVDSVVEVYSQPRPGRAAKYRQVRTYATTDVIPLVLDGKKTALIAVKDIIP